jgi:hypothetical protein
MNPRSSAIELVAKGLVRRGWVGYRPRCQGKSGDEVFVKLPIHAEADANARQVVVGNSLLEVGFATDSNVATKPETSDQRFQGTQLLTCVLGLGVDNSEGTLNLRHVSGSLRSQALRLSG